MCFRNYTAYSRTVTIFFSFGLLLFAGIGYALAQTGALGPGDLDSQAQVAIQKDLAKARKDPYENFLETRKDQYKNVRAKAFHWLNSLPLDPIALQHAGLKGKKIFAELVGALFHYYRFTDDSRQRADAFKRLKELKKVTETPAYHDMARVSPKVFKQGSMSYFRVLWLFENIGLDTAEYRTALFHVKKRMDDHMQQRGHWQRQMFSRYYDAFLLEKPKDIRDIDKAKGVVAKRLPAQDYRIYDAYNLSHEIYAAFDYGLEKKQNTFSNGDLVYLKKTLPVLVRKYIEGNKPDIVSELISNMTYLGFTHGHAYFEGIDFLLHNQNADGSWGRYPKSKKRYGHYAKQATYLHTTGVVMQSLLEVFENWAGK